MIVPARNAASTLGACLTSISDASAATGRDRADRGRQRLDGPDAPRSPPPPARSCSRCQGCACPRSAIAPRVRRGRRSSPSSTPTMCLAREWFSRARRLFAEPGIAAAGAEYRSAATMARGFSAPTTACVSTDRARSGRHLAAERQSGDPCRRVPARSADSTKRSRRAKTSTCAGDWPRLTGGWSPTTRSVSVHYGDPRTLGAVFTGEMWRGRDNLRVTLRPPMNLRSTLSALQPLVDGRARSSPRCS